MSVTHDLAPILIVDDNAGDINLVQEALSESGTTTEIRRAYDGRAAIALLKRVVTGEEPLPSLILLDINMPGIPGFEVLSYLRGEPVFDDVPVFMLSSSRRSADLSRAKSLGATGYIGKPESYAEYMELATRLRQAME